MKFEPDVNSSMPFAEKFAWLSLIAMVLCYGPYFIITHLNPPAEAGTHESLRQVWLFGAAAAGHGAIAGLGRFLLRPRQKPDERDRDVERRSTQAGYYVLLLAMMLVGVVLPLTESGWKVANTALLAIVLGEMLRNGVQVWNYRRGGLA
jgi:hypothetical protein